VLKKSGQISAISGATKLFAIVGNPVEQSLSPAFWNKALRYVGLDAVYVPMQVFPENAREAFTGLKALNVCGVNVTMPLKKDFAAFCHILHSPADTLNAVNTIKLGDIIEGWNTDATALKKVFSRLKPFKQALIMGAGSSAAAASWALTELSIKGIFQIARKHSLPGTDDSTDFIKKLSWDKKNFAYAIEESDIIINATPLGWKKDDFVVELEDFLDQNKIYVDLIYAPDSKLIAAARRKSCMVIDGRELLLEQGLEAFKILTGIEPPEKVIRDCIFNQA